MSERTRFQSQILLQLSRLARWCSGLAGSYSSKRKGLHRSVRLRSNTCTSTTPFRKLRGTEFRALGQDSRFESSFANSDPGLLSKEFFSPLLYNGARLCAERVCGVGNSSRDDVARRSIAVPLLFKIALLLVCLGHVARFIEHADD